jgi:adenylate kinase family enzyme
MKKLFACSLIFILAAVAATTEDRFRPAAVDQSVDAKAFPKESRRDEPKVFFAPKVVYPWEMHSGIAGEVILYVKIDELGYPKRIAVCRSTQQVFERYAVANVMQTNWQASDQSIVQGWFERRIVFARED